LPTRSRFRLLFHASWARGHMHTYFLHSQSNPHDHLLLDESGLRFFYEQLNGSA